MAQTSTAAVSVTSAPTPEPAAKARRRRRLPWQTVLVPLALLAGWEGAVAANLVDANLVPAPHTVAETWRVWIFGAGEASGDPYSGTWHTAAWASAVRVLAGFGLASAAGIVIGLLIGWFRLPRLLLQPVIDIMRPIPVTAWVPFAVVFFGIRPTASIALIALGTFFPVALNAAAGAMNTPRVLVAAAEMLGTSKRRIVWRVVFPSAIPSIVTGLRVGLALAWVLVIVSEMVAVKSGLGFSLWDAYYFGRTDVIVAAMFSVGILGYLSDRLLTILTARVMRWAPDVR